MMETFSPVDLAEVLAAETLPKSGTKWWVWWFMAAIFVVFGIMLLITRDSQKRRSNELKS